MGKYLTRIEKVKWLKKGFKTKGSGGFWTADIPVDIIPGLQLVAHWVKVDRYSWVKVDRYRYSYTDIHRYIEYRVIVLVQLGCEKHIFVCVDKSSSLIVQFYI